MHRRQHVTRLRVRRCDGQHAGILALELGADAAQILDLAQRTACRRDDGSPGRRERGEPLAVAHEHRNAELILELTHLLADAGLRREQRLGGIGHVETVIHDRAQIAQLLKIHREAVMTLG